MFGKSGICLGLDVIHIHVTYTCKCDIMSWYMVDVEMVMCLMLCESYIVIGYDMFLMSVFIMNIVDCEN